MRVLFWGTPEFAVPPLRALLGEGFEVVGVVTQPDRPQGRSRSTLVPSPVKQVALEEGLPVLQPDRPRGDEFLAACRALEPDISVVVAYGNLLPADAIALPPMGTLNIHGSLLPRWRGAAPIQAALLAGDAETGVCIMRMVQRLDAGPVLVEARTAIGPDETAGELAVRLSALGAEALVEALALMGLGRATETPQDESGATYAPKVDRAQARIDWTRDAAAVSRALRAYDPRPGAWSTLRGTEVRLFGPRVVTGRRGTPGEVLSVGEGGMIVACGTDALAVSDAHPAGRRRLAVLDWHQGRGIAVGDVLE